MAYCEICGKELPNVRDPQRLLNWCHNVSGTPLSCRKHSRVTLYRDSHLLKYNALTGKLKKS